VKILKVIVLILGGILISPLVIGLLLILLVFILGIAPFLLIGWLAYLLTDYLKTVNKNKNKRLLHCDKNYLTYLYKKEIESSKKSNYQGE